MLSEQSSGVFMIAVTPFDDHGGLDLASIDRATDFYIEREVDGLTVLGMMGEAVKLTAAESRRVVDRVIRRVAGRIPVVVGVPSAGFAGMRELAAAAMDLGASGVMVAPPGYLRTDASIVAFYRNVAETLGADAPFALQDFPQSTGVQIAADVIERIVSELPSCVMLKHEDWPGLAKITHLREASEAGRIRRISILTGNGGLFLPHELARGADGAMTGFAYPEMLVDVCRAFSKGEVERACDLFDAYLPLVRYEQQPGLGLAVRKYVLWKRGAIRTSTIRRPGPALSAADIADIEGLIARQERRLAALN